jgi:hypothetical protein
MDGESSVKPPTARSLKDHDTGASIVHEWERKPTTTVPIEIDINLGRERVDWLEKTLENARKSLPEPPAESNLNLGT